MSRSAGVWRPVIDMTGIAGTFDIKLKFSSEVGIAPTAQLNQSDTPEVALPPNPNPTPSLFTAIQEIGLRLESRQGNVDYIIVDEATRTPREN